MLPSMERPPKLVRENCLVFQGIPVPAFATWRDAEGNATIPGRGRPDFKCLDMNAMNILAENKLCGICGTAIMGSFVFLGGVQAMEHHYFRDAPMHEKCAKWAGNVCPFLSGRKIEHSKAPKAPGTNSFGGDAPSLPRGDKYGLYFTHGYRIVHLRSGAIGFHAADGGRVEWVYYPDTGLHNEDGSHNTSEEAIRKMDEAKHQVGDRVWDAYDYYPHDHTTGIQWKGGVGVEQPTIGTVEEVRPNGDCIVKFKNGQRVNLNKERAVKTI